MLSQQALEKFITEMQQSELTTPTEETESLRREINQYEDEELNQTELRVENQTELRVENQTELRVESDRKIKSFQKRNTKKHIP